MRTAWIALIGLLTIATTAAGSVASYVGLSQETHTCRNSLTGIPLVAGCDATLYGSVFYQNINNDPDYACAASSCPVHFEGIEGGGYMLGAVSHSLSVTVQDESLFGNGRTLCSAPSGCSAPDQFYRTTVLIGSCGRFDVVSKISDSLGDYANAGTKVQICRDIYGAVTSLTKVGTIS
jgi:hypothetical protein